MAHDVAIRIEDADGRHRAEDQPLLPPGLAKHIFGAEDRWRVVVRSHNQGRACRMTCIIDRHGSDAREAPGPDVNTAADLARVAALLDAAVTGG